MESVSGRPAAPLAGLVTYHGYRMPEAPSPIHRGLPSPYLTLIVTVDTPLLVERPGALARFDTVVGGLHVTPEMIHQHGPQAGVSVLLHPLAARALLGLPAAEIAHTSVSVDDLLGPLGRELHERVAGAPGWTERFAAVDAVLTRRLADTGPAVAPEVAHAWRLLHADRGTTAVGALAGEVGWSERHLGQRFRAELGVGPKLAARIERFHHARGRIGRRMRAGAPLALADVAADGGFTDQAHLAREFRALAGCSPTRWVAEEIGNVQDGVDGPSRESAS